MFAHIQLLMNFFVVLLEELIEVDLSGLLGGLDSGILMVVVVLVVHFKNQVLNLMNGIISNALNY